MSLYEAIEILEDLLDDALEGLADLSYDETIALETLLDRV